MDILLFVLTCIFLSLYIFHLRYQPYALEALKRGILSGSNTDGSFTMAVSNSFLSPSEKIPKLQIWDNLGCFSFSY